MVWKISLSIEQKGAGAELRVEYSNELLLGRTPPADVILNSVMVSRRHCWLRVDAKGQATVEDAGSTGGCRFNGERLTGERPFTESDQLELGDFTIRLTEPPSNDE